MRSWTILHTQNAPNSLCHGCPWPFPFFHEQGTNELLLDWSLLVMIYKWLYDWNKYFWGCSTQVIMNFKKNYHPNRPADQGQNMSTDSFNLSTQASPDSQSKSIFQNTPIYEYSLKHQNERSNCHYQSSHCGICTCCLYPYSLSSKSHRRHASLKGNASSLRLLSPYRDT